MASVRDLKDAAIAEQQKAVEIVDIAISAIDTLLNISQYVLAIFGGSLAILALVGVIVIYKAAVRGAEKVAANRFEDYIASEKFDSILDVKVRKAVDLWKENEAAKTLNVEDDGEPSEFDPPPQGMKRDDSI